MTNRIGDVPTINLPLHGWRALHSYYVDEVLKLDPETYKSVLEVVQGLTMDYFTRGVYSRILQPRIAVTEDDKVLVFLDFSPTTEIVEPVFVVRAEALGADIPALLSTEYERMDTEVKRILEEGQG